MADPLDGYDVVNDRARIATEYLFRVYNKFFDNDEVYDLKSESAIAFVEIIIRCWRDLYPDQYEARLEQQKTDWLVERTVQEANKADGGFFTVSYPPKLLQMLKAMLPKVPWYERATTKILVDNFPILKGTKYHI